MTTINASLTTRPALSAVLLGRSSTPTGPTVQLGLTQQQEALLEAVAPFGGQDSGVRCLYSSTGLVDDVRDATATSGEVDARAHGWIMPRDGVSAPGDEYPIASWVLPRWSLRDGGEMHITVVGAWEINVAGTDQVMRFRLRSGPPRTPQGLPDSVAAARTEVSPPHATSPAVGLEFSKNTVSTATFIATGSNPRTFVLDLRLCSADYGKGFSVSGGTPSLGDNVWCHGWLQFQSELDGSETAGGYVRSPDFNLITPYAFWHELDSEIDNEITLRCSGVESNSKADIYSVQAVLYGGRHDGLHRGAF